MLAPFTAGWQTADLNPLVIEKSEVYLVILQYYRNWQYHKDPPSPQDIDLLNQLMSFVNIVYGNLSWLQGSYVYDVNGKKYLDSLAGLWCTSLGILTATNLIQWFFMS